jgi:chromate transporter
MVTAVLHGVAAAATGLVFALTVQLGRKSLSETVDIAFVLVTAVAVHYLHIPVPWVLLVVGAIAIWWHRPRPAAEAAPGE